MPGENTEDWSVTAASNATADSSINWAEGQARATVNDSARSMMAAIAKDRNLKNGSITTAGTANAQTFTSGRSYTSVPTGLCIMLKIGAALTNTGSATLNMDGIGDVTIKHAGANLVGGELLADSYAEFRYDGTNWILLAPLVGEWTTWTPTITSTTGAITSYTITTARYRRSGKKITAFVHIVITDAGTGGSFLNVSLPFTGAATYCGTGVGREIVLTGHALAGQCTSTVAQFARYDAASLIATTAQFVLEFTYEAA